MKNLITLSLLMCLLLAVKTSMAQLGIGTTTPDGSSILDLTSTAKGMLAPRMTLAQKTAIATPATGLLIYQTDGAAGFYYYSGTAWVALVSTNTNTSWLTSGNTGTVDGTHYLGTADNIALNFRVNNVKAGRIDPAGPVFLGYLAGNSNTGANNTGIGTQSLNANTTGTANVATGYQALFANTVAGGNTATGAYALTTNVDGAYNTATGYKSLNFNTSGINNTGIGGWTLYSNTTGQFNNAFGRSALYANTTGNNNTAMGYSALYSNTTGSNNTALGHLADVASPALTNATAIGYSALAGASNSLVLGGTLANAVKVGIGNSVPTQTLDITNGNALISNNNNTAGMLMLQEPSTSGTDYTAFKAQAQAANVTYTLPPADGALGQLLSTSGTGALSWVYTPGWQITGNTGTIDGTNFIGTTDNKPFNIRVNNQKAGRIDNTNGITTLGYQAGNSITTGLRNTFIGQQAGFSNTTSSDNHFEGYKAGYNNLGGTVNLFVGDSTGYANTGGSQNTATGQQAFATNTTGNSNTAVGRGALQANTTASDNTAVGRYAMYKNTTGVENTAVGTSALYLVTTGQGNTGVGGWALDGVSTGNYNTFIGWNTSSTSSSIVNSTAIGANAVVNADNSIVLGGTGASAVNVGIGLTVPTRKLDVNGNARIGTNGTTIANVIKATVNIDVASVPASSAITVTFAVPNAGLTSSVMVSPSVALSNGLSISYARVSAANTVEVKFFNATAAAINPGAMNYYITVIE